MAIPTAASLYENYREKNWFKAERAALASLGLQLTDFDLTGKTKSDVEIALHDADIIYINGGNTYYLMEKINQSGFADVLRERLDQGALYIGSSAGTVVACPDISHIEHMDDATAANLTDYKGMGLIDFCVMPHMDHADYGPIAQALAAKAEPTSKMIGLCDDQAILVKGSYVEIL